MHVSNGMRNSASDTADAGIVPVVVENAVYDVDLGLRRTPSSYVLLTMPSVLPVAMLSVRINL